MTIKLFNLFLYDRNKPNSAVGIGSSSFEMFYLKPVHNRPFLKQHHGMRIYQWSTFSQSLTLAMSAAVRATVAAKEKYYRKL